MGVILTIAVPSYNIEKYIHKCIESFNNIKTELYSDFEVLIINDGSTDKTIDIVKKLSSETSLNLKIINKENGGHGSAVNKGIEEAKGKYFKIIDGDDWVNKADFEEFLLRLKKTDVDLIVTDYTEQHVYDNYKKRIKVLEMPDGYRSDSLSKIFPMHSITYRTSLLQEHNIRLTEKIFYVDTQYSIFPMKYVEKWEYWNLDVYQYFLGRPEQSMALINRLKHMEHHRIVMESILEFYLMIQNKELKDTLRSICEDLINTRYLLSFVSKERSKLLKQTTEYIEKYNIDFKFKAKHRTSYLLYFNEKNKRLFSFIVYPIVKFKLRELKN